MDAAHLLQRSGVDVLTFPDSPSGRTRADSILMAEKVARETGMCVMPHICCRDKNAIAMRSQLLGAVCTGTGKLRRCHQSGQTESGSGDRQSEEENGGRSHIFPDAANIHEGERG